MFLLQNPVAKASFEMNSVIPPISINFLVPDDAFPSSKRPRRSHRSIVRLAKRKHRCSHTNTRCVAEMHYLPLTGYPPFYTPLSPGNMALQDQKSGRFAITFKAVKSAARSSPWLIIILFAVCICCEQLLANRPRAREAVVSSSRGGEGVEGKKGNFTLNGCAFDIQNGFVGRMRCGIHKQAVLKINVHQDRCLGWCSRLSCRRRSVVCCTIFKKQKWISLFRSLVTRRSLGISLFFLMVDMRSYFYMTIAKGPLEDFVFSDAILWQRILLHSISEVYS